LGERPAPQHDASPETDTGLGDNPPFPEPPALTGRANDYPVSEGCSYRQDADRDPGAAAAEMRVHALLTGTITKRGDTLLVNAELVGVPEGTRLWGNRYVLAAGDLSSVQDRIASEIAVGLGLRLSGDDRARLSHAHATDPESYRLYLQARFFWNKRSKEGSSNRLNCFRPRLPAIPPMRRPVRGWPTDTVSSEETRPRLPNTCQGEGGGGAGA
jgi:hypothetical protein